MEREIILSSGLKMAALQWGENRAAVDQDEAQPVFLALHGWLDSAATFARLAPLILQEVPDACIVALDLIGYGRSEHRPVTASLGIFDSIMDAIDAADKLGWKTFHLIGHSMGGMFSSFITASYPERIRSLIMIDVLGAFSARAQDIVSVCRKGIDSTLKRTKQLVAGVPLLDFNTQQRSTDGRRMFKNLEAVAKRMVDTYLGGLTIEAARILAARTVTPVLVPSSSSSTQTSTSTSASSTPTTPAPASATPPVPPPIEECDSDVNGWALVFSYDLRHLDPSPIKFMEDQIRSVLLAISCPTLLLWASDGYPFPKEYMETRLERECCLRTGEIHTIEGRHHFHIDNPAPAMPAIQGFLQQVIQ